MDPTDENVQYIRVSKERECKIQVQFNSTILLFYALNIGSKFWFHFKEIFFFNSLLLFRSISKEQHCNNGYLPVVTPWVKGMDTTENCFAQQQTNKVIFHFDKRYQ